MARWKYMTLRAQSPINGKGGEIIVMEMVEKNGEWQPEVEHHICPDDLLMEFFELEELNSFGSAGWELVSSRRGPFTAQIHDVIYYLKHPL